MGIVAITIPAVTNSGDGVGVSIGYVLGTVIAVGAKALCNNESNETAGSGGVDYLIERRALRPDIGMSYQDEGYFGGSDVGYSFGSRLIDLGLAQIGPIAMKRRNRLLPPQGHLITSHKRPPSPAVEHALRKILDDLQTRLLTGNWHLRLAFVVRCY
ncbi:hypothetical protein [Pseudomonas sp.]|uniref:hypothetical protein n=1 Tax=Pseudomonas sp. TaxID=306 RepID=UPI0028AA372C|nr:hypothetical protein [Pseudomonas sp.]